MSDLIAKTAIDQRLAGIVTPVIEDLGYELVRLRLMGGKTATLQIMADKPEGGIEVDDCAKISTELSAILDVEDPITDEYTLEVSSPGVDRLLFHADHYVPYVGELLDVRLRLPIEGRRRFKGTLGSADGESIVIVVDDEPFSLPLRSIDRARAFPRLDINQGKN